MRTEIASVVLAALLSAAAPSNVTGAGAAPVSPLEAALTQLLDAAPDSNEFPVRADALRYEEGPDGIHYALVVDVELPAMPPGRRRPRYQILARLKDSDGQVVHLRVVEREYTIVGDPQSARLHLVWAGQVKLRPGRYTLETIVRNARLRTSARRVTFAALSYGTWPRVSSVAPLHQSGAQRLDDASEADDPFRLGDRPLMPAVGLKAAAAPDSKVEFLANAYPDPSNPAPVTVRAEVLRDGEVLTSEPVSLPPVDERGALRLSSAVPIGNLPTAEYQLRIVACQGDASAQAEATFEVERRPRSTSQAWPRLDRGELRELARTRDDAEAIGKLKRLDQADPQGDSEVLYLLSARYLRSRAYADAEKAARRAADLTQDPIALAEIHYALARALHDGEKQGVRPRSERLRAAEAALRKAIELTDGQNDTYHLHLAMVLFRLDRGAEARALLSDILERPDLPESIAVQARQLGQNPRCVTEVCLPQFSFVTPAGEYRTSEDLRGKVVLLSFWATWCGPCVQALPDIERLNARYVNEPFVLVGVNWEDDREAIEAFLAKKEVSWSHLTRAESARIQRRMEVRAIPTEMLFDHEGVAVGRSRGWGDSTYSELMGRVHAAVEKAKKAKKALAPEPRASAK